MAAALEGNFQDMEDHEEGEIVDESDDSNRQFESISDNSLESLPSIGKCDSSKNHSPDISSDVGEKHLWKKHLKKKVKLCRKKKTHCRHRYHHQHHHHHHHHHPRLHRHHRHHRSSSIDSSSSGSNHHSHRHRHKFLFSHSESSTEEYMMLNKSILKAAVRVNNSELHKNSLSSRLRAMAMVDNKSPEVQEVDKSVEQRGNEESGKEDDNELIQLRLAALRTAILNKKKYRKKRKLKEMQAVEEEIIEISDTLDNKENDGDMNPNKKPSLEMASDVNVEETKAAKIEINNPSDDDDEDVLRALLLASMSKKITRETKDLVVKENQNLNFHKHKIHYNMKKPFVNSNNKINSKIVKPPVMVRPLLHTKVNPLIINLKDDSETDEDANKSMDVMEQSKTVESKLIENSVEKFLREERAKIEAQKKKEADKAGIFEKSCMKLLPKSKQIEYQNLIQKLRNAQKVSQKPKKVQNKVHRENNHIVKSSKKLVRAKPISNHLLNNRGGSGLLEVPDLVKDARDLQKVIREMQSSQSNGRLQMQAKYTSLTPIVKKINEASIERKKYDKEVKRLLEELTEAKKKLRGSHIHFKMYVRELIGKKEEIDKKPPTVEQQSVITSTPCKKEASFSTCQSSPIVDTKDNSTKENSSVSDREYTDDSINVGDPNDIDKIYCTVPKYISPLDNTLRPETKDPFSIMCPYDIDGNCKDSECIYKHYHE